MAGVTVGHLREDHHVSTSYSPTPVALPATITLPQDLVDQRTAASVNVPFKSIADGVAYLMETVTHTRAKGCGDPLGRVRAGPEAKTYDLKGKRLDPWEDGASLPVLHVYGERIRCSTPETGSNIATHFVYDVTDMMINGATITDVRIWCANPNSVALPGMMPGFALVRYSPTADTWESTLAAGMRTDPSAVLATYQGVHEVKYTADQNATVDLGTYAYYIVICPEGGTNGIEGLSFYRMTVEQTARRFLG
jgi:hypothetical protein